ncbi:MAG: hypothetical protein PVI86_20240 [Phycisphaerae bacterium]|jgi:hypothetical protein
MESLTVLMPWLRTNRPLGSSTTWLAMAFGMLISAVIVGWQSTTLGRVAAGVLLALAVLALWQGIRTRTTENLHAIRKLEGACIHCGYDLEGNESGVCPECGQPTDKSMLA